MYFLFFVSRITVGRKKVNQQTKIRVVRLLLPVNKIYYCKNSEYSREIGCMVSKNMIRYNHLIYCFLVTVKVLNSYNFLKTGGF